MWVGSSTHYPNPTVTPGTVTSASVTYNELSGIRYLKTATFTVPGQAGNMFNPSLPNKQCSMEIYLLD